MKPQSSIERIPKFVTPIIQTPDAYKLQILNRITKQIICNYDKYYYY
nr:MAG TPA: hypothetical protein [Caudoviricetes sp.]